MKEYVSILIPLVAIDAAWLGIIASSFYKKYLGHLLAEKFVLWPGALFYLIYSLGILYFVVSPALAAKSLAVAVTRGALLGLVAYAAYDLTNHATLSKWPPAVTVVDMLWGVCLTVLVSVIAYFIIQKFQ